MYWIWSNLRRVSFFLGQLSFILLIIVVLNIKKINELRFTRSPGCVSTVLDGETVILDVETGVYSGLNDVGTVLWEVLEKKVLFADMCGALSEIYDITTKECSEDVLAFLEQLAGNKLIEVSGGANT